MALEIERCNGLLHADEIKAFFLRNDRPTFPMFFDRAYPPAMAAGGSSWIARDECGAVVGHLAAFPRRFRSAVRSARAALLVDLLMAGAHRDFWSAVQLCRRAVNDMQAFGDFDFAFTDPTLPAELVLRAAGFTACDALERFVTPLSMLYNGFFRITARTQPLLAERVSRRRESRVADVLRAVPPGPSFRVERSLELYATRLGGDSIRGWEWLVFRRRERGAADAALALTARHATETTLSIVDLVWDDRQVSAASVLQAIIEVARREGYRKLSVVSLRTGALTHALRGRGFIRRADALPLYVRRLAGPALPPSSEWLMTSFDGSGW